MLNDKKKILVSTGNILSVNKKAGQKTNEEVSKIRQHFFVDSKIWFLFYFRYFFFICHRNSIFELEYIRTWTNWAYIMKWNIRSTHKIFGWIIRKIYFKYVMPIYIFWMYLNVYFVDVFSSWLNYNNKNPLKLKFLCY